MDAVIPMLGPALSLTSPKSLPHGRTFGLALRTSKRQVSCPWLFDQVDLNLTTTSKAGDWDNTMYVDPDPLFASRLTLTVNLLSSCNPTRPTHSSLLIGGGKAPSRYAHVVIDHRATTEPFYADILVGPLPIVNGTTQWVPLEYPYTRKTNGRVRNIEADDGLLYSNWLLGISQSVSDITLGLWNATYLGLDNDTISMWGIDPLSQEQDRITRWDQFWNEPTSDFDDSTLATLGALCALRCDRPRPIQMEAFGLGCTMIFSTAQLRSSDKLSTIQALKS